MEWSEFNDGLALAHVIAYLREFVMNVTTRSPLNRIFIRPMNAHAIVRRFEERQIAASESAPESGPTSQ